MTSQIKINYTTKVGGGIIVFASLFYFFIWWFGNLTFFDFFYAGLMFVFGIIITIIGLVWGNHDKWKCDYCNAKFDHKGLCAEHEKTCNNNPNREEIWECEKCGKEFKSKLAGEKHEKNCKGK